VQQPAERLCLGQVLNAITEEADINALVSVVPGAENAKSVLMSAAMHGHLEMVNRSSLSIN